MDVGKSALDMRKIFEGTPKFVPALPDEANKRKTDLGKKLLPLTEETSRLRKKYFDAWDAFDRHLDRLPGGSDDCDCADAENALNMDSEYVEIPGDEGMVGRCLRCGGYVDLH